MPKHPQNGLVKEAEKVSVQEQKSAGEAAIGGTFTLLNQDGKTVKDTDLNGKPSLVFFGFTHCPDICPTGLLTLTQVMETLGENANVTPVFISVDPERDTVARMKEYLTNFHPSIVGLTGGRAAVDQVIQAYKVYAKKQPGETEQSYMMDHSGFIYLMDADGKYQAHFAHNAPVESIVEKVQALDAKGTAAQ
ncbi:MAG: SCO family protein [Hyphomicrobiales bacterium]|nr:SCO family protein [Hyphomicrobiales bacterium]